ncbi:MAG: hypothetical protein KDJ27_17545 [Gammaproteobacteria bacterium]|nr:hypothetical protein [Gammaproteobacteria bacterium]
MTTNGNHSHTERDLRQAALAPSATALFAISAGTPNQKRFGGSANLLTVSFYQSLATALVMHLRTQITECSQFEWSAALIVAPVWLTLVLSIAAIKSPICLIREGESAHGKPAVTGTANHHSQGLGAVRRVARLRSLVSTAIVVLDVHVALRARIKQ